MDYEKSVVDFQVSMIEKLVLDATDDAVVTKINHFVHMAVSKEMTGKEKFDWVVEQVEPLVFGAIKLLAKFLVQLVYDMMMGYKEDLVNGK